MPNYSSRYDIVINDDTENINLDFVLPKPKEKMIHGTIWNDDNNPQVVEDAAVFIYTPGPKYFDSDPNDLKCIDYVIPDSNGQFAAGPFPINATIILKIYNINNRQNLEMPNDIPEDFKYILKEYNASLKNDISTLDD
ncbi:hypothetical protein [Clostridium butyricum]|uniref:Uncharacterized protein n=2 Tax=root TaxID=1 RepID=A0A512TMW9_CLOBU|nr:hypothetical protein [Clostridium butyricum]MBZ5746636.1 hypothetical protein [Clostridium butyricum]MDK2828749.1 hypothetical protein [Clostridium butyricum]MDU1006158.1 hypothetical protein [Clostridium butyricum]NAS19281.1 hypothetical protein [Clostridium butyricum]NOW22003.1 hypothetical protein [Clostridium butyricum]